MKGQHVGGDVVFGGGGSGGDDDGALRCVLFK